MDETTEKLVKAVEGALDDFEVVYRTGRPAQGGEQRGNWECIENSYRRLKYTLEAFRASH